MAIEILKKDIKLSNLVLDTIIPNHKKKLDWTSSKKRRPCDSNSRAIQSLWLSKKIINFRELDRVVGKI